MKKIAGIVRQDTGVGWYRIIHPIMGIGRTGVKFKTNRFTGQNENATLGDINSGPHLDDKTIMKIAKGSDVIWSTIILDYDEILKMLNLRMWSGAKWIVDMDDDLYNVSVSNPMKKRVDKSMRNIELCLQLADGITVSTPKLKEVYEPLNDHIYINPNTQTIESWDEIRKPIKPHKGFRIGWRGASGHQADVSLVKYAIEELKKDHDITLVTIGVENEIESEHHKWVGAMDFPGALAKLNLDMAVVPLVDSNYNKCKSNIAIQEFGGLKIPVVASPIENQNGMPILYAKNNYEWYESIEKLIKKKKYRKQMGENLYNHVKKEWDVDKKTPKLVEWMEKLPRKDIKP